MKIISKLSGNIYNTYRTIITSCRGEQLCPKCQEKAINLLKNIKLDAEMALDDRWDRSNDGFETQIDLIDEFLKEIEDE